MWAMYSRSKAAPERVASLSNALRCDASSSVGKVTPFDSASCSSSALAWPWSVTMRPANCFTKFDAAFCWASLPASTSAMPPIAASARNLRSLLASFVLPALGCAATPLGVAPVWAKAPRQSNHAHAAMTRAPDLMEWRFMSWLAAATARAAGQQSACPGPHWLARPTDCWDDPQRQLQSVDRPQALGRS